ncbi:AhpC/TSA family protein [Mucilaginibacter hurinus]|uniref:AhpC/TSA family protein n=1 Tax=Mucilaginibacter hurinus TaxID=2201324 RepID=A0A367GK21_9SPHI|nr:thioredoxin fold domain-containing protein [Mucilaginibacter hurinus]RCH53670.1 AhpC/TSA family protein [Mucilaginibacter hurinus]
MRKKLVFIWLTFLIVALGAIFWYNDWVYQLPTPVPEHYKAVKFGSQITNEGVLDKYAAKPVFLHFFNPRCPCSKFNITHFKALVKEYGSRINFVIVVVSPHQYTEKQIQDKFNINLPVVFDSSLASACGVYSTPQAVLLDSRHQLYYRGNYNSSRYCTDEKTSYAKIALKGLLQDNTRLFFNAKALTAYGCGLPDNCKY